MKKKTKRIYNKGKYKKKNKKSRKLSRRFNNCQSKRRNIYIRDNTYRPKKNHIGSSNQNTKKKKNTLRTHVKNFFSNIFTKTCPTTTNIENEDKNYKLINPSQCNSEWKKDKIKNIKIQNFLGNGAYNKVYTFINDKHPDQITNDKVVRLTKKIYQTKDDLKNNLDHEIKGNQLQFLHFNDCPYIPTIYQWGFYSRDKVTLKNDFKRYYSDADTDSESGIDTITQNQIPKKLLNKIQYGIYSIIDKISGSELKEMIEANKYIENPLLQKILFKNIVRSVLCIHKKNIGHYDLKPQNIMMFFKYQTQDIPKILYKTTIQLIDFGFAREDPKHGKFLDRKKFGTPIYISPEMWNEEPYNYKCDIWSLGIIFFQILMKILPVPKTFKDFEDIKNYTTSLPFIIEIIKNNKTIPIATIYFKIKDIYEKNYKCSSNKLIEHLRTIDYFHQVNGDEALTLLASMLKVNPDERPTCEQILDHSWFDEIRTEQLKENNDIDPKIKNLINVNTDFGGPKYNDQNIYEYLGISQNSS